MSKEIKTVKNTNEEVRIEVMIDELVKKLMCRWKKC